MSGRSTAESAALNRAAHARYAVPPVLDDTFAEQLLTWTDRLSVRIGPVYRRRFRADHDRVARVSAVGIGCLRQAEQAVLDAVEAGIGQYVVLGAGFDTFAYRHPELAGSLQVFEVDLPATQSLKRERVARARAEHTPVFVPVDFETTSLAAALTAEPEFAASKPCIVSWMNTLPYLTVDAIEQTLDDLSVLMSPGSRLVVNYGVSGVELTADQRAFLEMLGSDVRGKGEPMQSRFAPVDFLRLLDTKGFDTVDHATEDDLTERWFSGRTDGFAPGLPTRVVTAEQR